MTSREINNSLGIRITKNIDLLCAMYDSGKTLEGK
jgi:hypothetical protein